MKCLCFILCVLPCLALANDWSALKEDGAIAVMRHAIAPGTGDPSAFKLGDCSTQRNLNERGREQAHGLGEAFRERGIVFDIVFTSQWCRTRETAELLDVGPVVEAPSLKSFFRDFSTRSSQTRETHNLIEDTAGKRMLVTRQVNISALTGQGARSGEVLVIRLVDRGVEVTGKILVEP